MSTSTLRRFPRSERMKQVWMGSVALATAMLCVAPGLVHAQEDITVTDKSFSCIRDGTKVRNTYIRNADPQRLARSRTHPAGQGREHRVPRRDLSAAGAGRGHGETSQAKVSRDERVGVLLAGAGHRPAARPLSSGHEDQGPRGQGGQFRGRDVLELS